MLTMNLENFSKVNSTDSSGIIIFNKATNLFTPRTPDLGTLDLDTSCYVACNCVLSYLKELFTWFFIFSTESRVEKLLQLDV